MGNRIITILPIVAEKRRVACYCRVSSLHDDQFGSIEAQQEHFLTVINDNPDYTLVGAYVDHGLTGTKKDIRPGLMQLLRDCRDHKIDLVLTKSISRLARNSLDCINTVRSFRDLGVEIYFERENLSTASMEGELGLSIMATLAEDEARQVSNNAKWAIAKRFKMGTYRFAKAPYGFIPDGYVFRVDAEKKLIVHRIFMAALMGRGTSVIATTLTREGIPSPSGLSHWSPHTVNRILRDPVYVGDLTMQKTYTDENYRQHVNKGEVDQFVDDDHHDAIVSREVFALVGEELSRRAQQHGIAGGARRSTDLPLVCSCCGAPMWKTAQYYRIMGGAMQEEGDSHQYYYVCSTRRKDPKKCDACSVLTQSVENAIATMVNKLLFISDRVKQARKEADDAITDAVERRFDKIILKPGEAEFHFFNGLVLVEKLNTTFNVTKDTPSIKGKDITAAGGKKGEKPCTDTTLLTDGL